MRHGAILQCKVEEAEALYAKALGGPAAGGCRRKKKRRCSAWELSCKAGADALSHSTQRNVQYKYMNMYI